MSKKKLNICDCVFAEIENIFFQHQIKHWMAVLFQMAMSFHFVLINFITYFVMNVNFRSYSNQVQG